MRSVGSSFTFFIRTLWDQQTLISFQFWFSFNSILLSLFFSFIFFLKKELLVKPQSYSVLNASNLHLIELSCQFDAVLLFLLYYCFILFYFIFFYPSFNF